MDDVDYFKQEAKRQLLMTMDEFEYFKQEAKRQLLTTAATWSAIVLVSLMVGAFIWLFWIT